MVFMGYLKFLYAPSMKDVTLRQLTFLTETVRTGSLAGAAEALHLTGPAVAQQLRLLEKRIGLPLLERGPGGQHPTEAGRLLLESAGRIEAELAACGDALDELRRASAGRVRIGAVSTAKYFAPHVLASFRDHRPGVQVSISVGNRDEVLRLLETFEVDLTIMGRPPSNLDVEQQVFGEHPYVIAAPPGHPMVGRHVSFEEVAHETFLAREQSSGTRSHLDALFTSAELQPRIGMEITSNETIKQAVMAGLGVALLSAHTICAEVADGRIAVLDVEGLPINRHWLVVRMGRRSLSPAAAALWDYIVAEGGARLPTMEDPSP